MGEQEIDGIVEELECMKKSYDEHFNSDDFDLNDFSVLDEMEQNRLKVKRYEEMLSKFKGKSDTDFLNGLISSLSCFYDERLLYK